MAISQFPSDVRFRLLLGRALHLRHDHYGEYRTYLVAVQMDPASEEAHRMLESCRAEIDEP